MASLADLAAQTQLVTHRGYWDCEGSAENSIASLKKSKDVNAYGSELDVIITADGVPVVHHDSTIDGILIEEANYDQIKDRKLSNGEVLPTLESYLQAFKEIPDMKLVLEVKPHKRVGMDMDYHYEVFDKNPTWIKESKDLGVKVNVWTVNDPAIMQSLVEQDVDFITTNAPLELNKILKH